jgi:hypothetical protein
VRSYARSNTGSMDGETQPRCEQNTSLDVP